MPLVPGWLMQGVARRLIAGLLLRAARRCRAHRAVGALSRAGRGYHVWRDCCSASRRRCWRWCWRALVKVSKRGHSRNSLMVTIAIGALVGIRLPADPGSRHHPVGGPYRRGGPLADALGRRGGARRPAPASLCSIAARQASDASFSTTAVWLRPSWLGPLAAALRRGSRRPGRMVYTLQGRLLFGHGGRFTFRRRLCGAGLGAQQAVEVYGWLRPARC